MSKKKWFTNLIPPPRWKLPVILALGVFVGVGLMIIRISNAASYLSNDPDACINCHVMTTQYATWQRSSHARVATCADCHVPQDNFLRKYLFKAADGGRHTTMFTFRLEPQVIKIKSPGQSVVQENCIRCHNELINTSSIVGVTGSMARHGEGKFCWDCHREVPHGRVRSLSSVPLARTPDLKPALPEWFENNKSENK
ncbi:MAG: cytochrome c nitrite reductase small subunit [Ignavibacteriales bacterium]|nr:cytochrome c nitrite reductase small subunit [Ignavibacteriales bacterium]HOJ17951.1 cytochrome c nitrite reductase small subunit [Ignavibacteriaceae bacterium]